MRPSRSVLALVCLFALFPAGLMAQAAAATKPEPYQAEEFPLFLREARRFEIVAIGSFPLMVFYSTLVYDIYRFTSKSIQAGEFATAYLPWPLKGPNAVELTLDEKGGVLIAALSASVLVGILDWAILKMRAAAAKAERARMGRNLYDNSLSQPSEGPPPNPGTETITAPDLPEPASGH